MAVNGIYEDPKLNSYEHEKELSQNTQSEQANLVYDDVEEEPELHARTYIAVAAMFLLNYIQVVALTGPPAAVSSAVSRPSSGLCAA